MQPPSPILICDQNEARQSRSQTRKPSRTFPGSALAYRVAPRSPDVDRGEEEQPDHVHEVPVPGGKLEAEMLGRGELARLCTRQADDQEDGANDDMEAVKTGRHEESGAIDVARV